MASQKSDITLYTTQTPNGIKISITLEELGYVHTPFNYHLGRCGDCLKNGGNDGHHITRAQDLLMVPRSSLAHISQLLHIPHSKC